MNIANALLTTLGSFQATGDYSLSNAQPLAIAGVIGASSIELYTGTTQVSPITQTGGSLTANTVNIYSGNTFTQSAGTITATAPGGVWRSSGAARSLSPARYPGAIVTLEPVAGNLTLSGNVTAPNYISLAALGGAITQSGGTLTTPLLIAGAGSVALGKHHQRHRECDWDCPDGRLCVDGWPVPDRAESGV